MVKSREQGNPVLIRSLSSSDVLVRQEAAVVLGRSALPQHKLYLH